MTGPPTIEIRRAEPRARRKAIVLVAVLAVAAAGVIVAVPLLILSILQAFLHG